MDRAVPAGIPSGHAQLDAQLPGGGWPRGTLTEILHDGTGLGEVSLLFGALKAVAEEDRGAEQFHMSYHHPATTGVFTFV